MNPDGPSSHGPAASATQRQWNRSHPVKPQRGATLLLGLLLLALLSLSVTSAFSDNQWQLRLGKNQTAEQRAERAAYSALEWAEDWLMSLPGDSRPAICSAACNAGEVILAAGRIPAAPEQRSETWWLDNGHPDGFEPVGGNLLATRQVPGSPAGRWLIEEVHVTPDDPVTGAPEISYFRILARAPRMPRGTAVVLETVVARPWGADHWHDELPGDGVEFCRQAGVPDQCGRLAWQRRQ